MKIRLCFFFLLLSCFAVAQETGDPTKGTIKIEKKGQIYSILFDEVNYRLVGKDQYGNIRDSAVVSFDIFMTVKGVAYQESNVGPMLSLQFQQYLSRLDRETQVFFTNIKVREKNGTLIDWPKFSVKLGKQYDRGDY